MTSEGCKLKIIKKKIVSKNLLLLLKFENARKNLNKSANFCYCLYYIIPREDAQCTQIEPQLQVEIAQHNIYIYNVVIFVFRFSS